MPYQRSASNSASSTRMRDAVGQRGDDAVGGAGDPAGVGGAPEDVVRVQVERVAPVAWWATTASCTWTAPFGVPVVPLVKCSSAGSSGSVGGMREVGARVGQQRREARTPSVAVDGLGADEQHVLEAGSWSRRRGDPCARYSVGVVTSTAAVAEREPLPDRLGPERREERADHGAGLQRAQHGDVELGHPAAQGEDPLARADARGRRGRWRSGSVAPARSRVGDVARSPPLRPSQRSAHASRRGRRRRGGRLPRGRCSARRRRAVRPAPRARRPT